MFSRIRSDLALAVRTVRRQPVFAGVVVTMLALGIGANTAMFALVHAALLKQLPYKDPDRLVLARRTYPGRLLMWNSPPDYYDYRDQTPGFETLAASSSQANDTMVFGGERPEAVRSLEVTHDLLPMLGVEPIAGRLFTEAEARAEAPYVVLISSRLAGLRFGSTRAAVGKTLIIFALAVSLATGLFCGVVPALRVSSLHLAEHLAPGARATGSRRGSRLRGVLVAGQVGLSLLLLIGAGLLVRSLAALMATDLRFRAEHLLATSIDLPPGTAADRQQFQALLEQDLAAIPGVTDIALTSHMPILEPWEDPPVWPKDHPPLGPAHRRSALWRRVSPGFFNTLGIRLLAGRDLPPLDRLDTPRVMVVNDTFSRQFFPGGDAVGQRVMMGNPTKPDEYLIVGVVETARTEGVVRQPQASMYVSANQAPLRRATVLLRSALPPGTLTRAIRNAVAARNGDLIVSPVVSVHALLAESLFSERVTALTVLAFAGLALLLAALGLYGVLTHHVASRTHEIGVRVALGAGTGHVVRQVLWRSASMVGPGLLGGILAAIAATKVTSRFLHGVRPTDPLTFAGVTVLLALVALAASVGPARRASRVDPVEALRGE